MGTKDARHEPKALPADERGERAVTIREAEPVDVVAVTALDARITGLAKPDYWRRAYTRYGTRPTRYFLVAEIDGRVRGFVLGEERAWEFGSPPSGWVFAIGVDPEARESGIGTKLFAAICVRMKASGVKTVRTMLARDDALNMAFFRSQGMRGGPFIQLEMPLDDGMAGEPRR
jgi:ribosomal protein S18 acetylase RimI-like enzyme